MANQYPNITRALSRIGVLAGFFVLALIMGAGCMFTTVGAGEGGVKFSQFTGTDSDQSYGEGFHVHAPWADIIEYDVRFQETMEQITALSNNGLSIRMDISVRYRPIMEELPQIHQTFGPDYYRKLVQPELRSVAREVVGRYTPEELYSSKRTELQEQIAAGMISAVEAQNIDINAVLIRDVQLPDQIRASIERKLQEEQEAQRYQFTLEKEQLEAQRKKIEAEGQSEYQRIITASLSPQFLRFKGIEATRELANSENSKTVVIGSGGDGLP
ncbi:MAG: prohibitin family protein, partial [Bacteroidota bacterium]